MQVAFILENKNVARYKVNKCWEEYEHLLTVNYHPASATYQQGNLPKGTEIPPGIYILHMFTKALDVGVAILGVTHTSANDHSTRSYDFTVPGNCNEREEKQNVWI